MTSDKAPDAFRTISEAAEDLDLPQHVLRFWETRFSQIKPLKRGGGRRYYRPDDVEFLRGLKHLLHAERYTIKGVQKIIKEQGVKAVQGAWKSGAQLAPPALAASPGHAPVATPLLPVVALPTSARTRLEAALAELMDCRRQIAAFRQA
jgi:DNA-binding transcriptional MerR regulator